MCKQLFVLADLEHQEIQNLTNLREAMGILQHHDAISGTAKEYVTYNYQSILYKGIADSFSLASGAIK